jgi:hypothetical protein
MQTARHRARWLQAGSFGPCGRNERNSLVTIRCGEDRCPSGCGPSSPPPGCPLRVVRRPRQTMQSPSHSSATAAGRRRPRKALRTSGEQKPP